MLVTIFTILTPSHTKMLTIRLEARVELLPVEFMFKESISVSEGSHTC